MFDVCNFWEASTQTGRQVVCFVEGEHEETQVSEGGSIKNAPLPTAASCSIKRKKETLTKQKYQTFSVALYGRCDNKYTT